MNTLTKAFGALKRFLPKYLYALAMVPEDISEVHAGDLVTVTLVT